MKKPAIFSVIIFLFFIGCGNTQVAFGNNNADLKAQLITELNKILPSSSFSIHTLDYASSTKSVQGSGTFFGKSGVGFKAQYGAEGYHNFSATLGSNNKVAISNQELTNLTGQPLERLVPNALKKSVYLEGFSISFNEESKKAERVQLDFNSLKNWEFLQAKLMALEQIKIVVKVEHPTDQKIRKVSSILTGFTKIAGQLVELSADLKEQKEQLILTGTTSNLGFKKTLQSILGKKSIQGITIPNFIVDVKLNDINIDIAPYQKSIGLAAVSNLGKVDVWTKKKKKEYDYVVTVALHSDFKLSKLSHHLKVLDRVPLGGQKMVFSSAKKTKKESSKIPSLAQIKSGIRKGASLVTTLDVRKLKLEHLIKAKELVLTSPLTKKLDGIVLEKALDTNVELGPSASLKEVYFRLTPAPKDFAITLMGTMETKIANDILQFKGGVEVDIKSQAINFIAMMKGTWNNPLGAKGLVMTDVGIQLGASLTTAPVILPNIALSGNIKIGSFNGAAHLAFDTRNPTKSMIAANFNKLGLMDLMSIVVDKKVIGKIPGEMQKTLQTINMQDVKMEIVPQRLEVLEKTYDPGFRTAGSIRISGFKGTTELDIDYTKGISSKGTIDPIDTKAFKITGANGNKKPAFNLNIQKGKTPQMGINGLVNMMGMKAATDIELLPNGFKFKLGGQLFNLFKGDITAKGKDLSKAGEMGLKVKMENDILNFLDENTTKFIQNSTKGAVSKLTKAQKSLTKAQNAVKQLDKEIAKQRKIVAQKQKAKRAKYDAAKRKLTAAQAKVNQLNKEISSLKKQKSRLKKYQVARKTAINTKIVSIQGYRVTALGVLEGAKLAMNGFKGMNTNPDLHPKVATLISSKATAMITLEAAKKTLEGVKITLGFTGKVASMAIDKGADFLINIRKVDFAGKLGRISGGAVKLNTDLEWLGKKHNIKFNFNMKNPTASIENLAKKLLKLK